MKEFNLKIRAVALYNITNRLVNEGCVNTISNGTNRNHDIVLIHSKLPGFSNCKATCYEE